MVRPRNWTGLNEFSNKLVRWKQIRRIASEIFRKPRSHIDCEPTLFAKLQVTDEYWFHAHRSGDMPLW
jgi:hypothetical protein